MKRSTKGGKAASRQKKTGNRKAKRVDDSETQQIVEEEFQVQGEEGHQPREEEDDDDAPEEMPVSKSAAAFIPLKAGKKRKRKKPKAATAEESSHALPGNDGESEVVAPKKPKQSNQFFERLPGHYFGSKRAEKFRVVDLSSNANIQSVAQKRAIELKTGMFNRHRRVPGNQLLGILHKSKMVGKG